jgi:hypothetical protein
VGEYCSRLRPTANCENRASGKQVGSTARSRGRGCDEAELNCWSSSDDALSRKEGFVTDFFTRATWRAGGRSKLRKRVNNYGGCKVAPPAFLAAAKLAAIKPGRANRRLCSSIKRDGTPCRRLAMRGCAGCECHGGIRMLVARGEFQPSGRTAAFKAARAAAVEGRSPQVSLELINLPVYRQANGWTRLRLARAWGTTAWLPLVRQIQSQQ